MTQRRTLLAALLGSLLAAIAAPAALAQQWPSKAVHIVVPAPAGSSLDIIARLLSEKLKDRWGQAVVVDNKAGAGGMLGVDVAAKAPPDGYTIALGFNGPIAFAPFMYRKMPYDPGKDLIPVVMTTSQPNVLAVNANLPVKTTQEFLAWTKERAGKMNYSSLGMGSSSHLTMELMLNETGLTGTHVPYNGSPPAALAVAQGDTDATFTTAPALLNHVKAGKVRLLAVSAAQVPESLKGLPTLADGGVKGVESLAWNGLFVAAGTPEAIVQKINADVNTALADAQIKSVMDAQGLTVVGGTQADFRKVVDAEMKRWGAVIQKIGLKLD
ncbi:tripartite tricarboxylate transporter substrate binding protein [Aquincola sp. MAHUQ-54]|uniref:Tripartite tricarboxylate transporter substrate binding protein n=1 Tax=Aquincola agrisoli TaxID=3119538 RepID=A0AAW9QPG8_9BURK